jgi:hypothetical protein
MANKDEIDGMKRSNSAHYDAVKELAETMGLFVDLNVMGQDVGLLKMRANAVEEQMRRVVGETLWEDALGNPKIDERDLTEELAKLIYAIYGFAVTFGLQVDAAFDAVHERRIAELRQTRGAQDDGE